MNISNISDQIEIRFWMGIVSLLHDRRINRSGLLLLAALTCLAFLLLTAFSWAFVHLPESSPAPKAAAIHTAAFLSRPENGQKNLLLVLVDRNSDPQPSLEGAWMLIYSPSGLKVTFMPIYPARSAAAAGLKETFRPPRGGGLPPSFVQALKAQGLWWDNHLVIDYAMLARLVELAGGIDIGSGLSNGQQVVGLLPIAGQDAQTALEFQGRIAQGICRRFDAILFNASPEAMADLFSGGTPSASALSDLNPQSLRQSWVAMRRAGGLDCEFPTLIGR
jgi:hypothetical protein